MGAAREPGTEVCERVCLYKGSFLRSGLIRRYGRLLSTIICVCKTETETERDCVQAKVQQDEYVYYECKREALIVSRSASAVERQFDEQFLASAVDEYEGKRECAG